MPSSKVRSNKRREKFNSEESIRESRYSQKFGLETSDYKLNDFTPTEEQQAIVQSMVWNDLTVINGPAGVGKTTAALWKALKMMREGDFRRLIFIKNPSEVGDDAIGFLSGDKNEKLTAHYESTKRIFHTFMAPNKLENDIKSMKIELTIPNYALGATWDNAIILIDEAQLMSPNTIKLLLERTGANSRVVLMGDVKQVYSIKKRDNGLSDLMSKILDENGNPIEDFVGYIKLSTKDNQRSRLSQYITEIY